MCKKGDSHRWESPTCEGTPLPNSSSSSKLIWWVPFDLRVRQGWHTGKESKNSLKKNPSVCRRLWENNPLERRPHTCKRGQLVKDSYFNMLFSLFFSFSLGEIQSKGILYEVKERVQDKLEVFEDNNTWRNWPRVSLLDEHLFYLPTSTPPLFNLSSSKN